MDPATAIGVASAAITFMDFTITVCQTFREIKSSTDGATKENADIEEAERRCKRMSEQLQMKKNGAASAQLGPDLELCVEKCNSISTELLDLLARIRDARNSRMPGKAVYLVLRHQGKIKELQGKAEGHRVTLAQGLIHATWDTASLNLKTSEDGYRSLDRQSIAILQALKDGERREMDLLLRLGVFRQEANDAVQDLLPQVERGNKTSDRIERKLDDVARKILTMGDPGLKGQFVESLYFPDFQAREKDISPPEPSTFDWFLDHASADTSKNAKPQEKPTWPSFPRWLEAADSSTQYWLSGKAGSGKSTLMASMIRNDLQGRRTRKHLKVWSGPRSLHVLSFFLYRPKLEVQAGMEHLLRSLLYQLVKGIPQMQESLMTQFWDPDIDGRIPTWPVSQLKAMLELALDTAQDCNFFIFIDGVDEFQDFQNPNEESTTASDLVDFLYQLQKPANVKLCISSRPELVVARRYPTFSEAKLADLNWDDICAFVDGHLNPISHRKPIIQEICTRANGIFMWAVFAVRQMNEEDADEKSYPKLLERLDDTGRGLHTAIASMLRGLPKHRKRALAFYLYALKSWRDSKMSTPFSVALLAASRSNGEHFEIKSYQEFLDRCQEEERSIQACSRGLIEVKSGNSRHRGSVDKAEKVLVKIQIEACGDGNTQHNGMDFEVTENSWRTVMNHDVLRDVEGYISKNVSWIHRTAYDFFFAAEDHNESLMALMDSINPSTIPRQVRQGMQRLRRIQPVEYFQEDWERQLSIATSDRSIEIIRYTACGSFSTDEAISVLVDILSETRLELLNAWGYVVPRKPSGHIPGDLFSDRLLDDCLRLTDEDVCRDIGLRASDEILRSLRWLETGLIATCGGRDAISTFRDHLSATLAVLHRSHYGRLLLVGIMMRSPEFSTSSTDLQAMTVEALQRWSNELARGHTGSTSLFSWIQRHLTRHGANLYLCPREPYEPRLSAATGLRNGYFQWTPQCSNESANWYVNYMLQYLIAGLKYRNATASRNILDGIIQITKPWDVWTVVNVKRKAWDTEPTTGHDNCSEKHSTRIFVSLTHLCTSDIIYRHYRLPTPIDRLSYRLIHFAHDDGKHLRALFSHHGMLVAPDAADKITQRVFYGFHDPEERLQEWEAAAIIQDLRESAALNEAQKETFIRDIDTWELLA